MFGKHILGAIGKMLNLFAATRNKNYTKNDKLYLQKMAELKAECPWVYQQFANKGFHCVRRKDKFKTP